MNKLFITLLSIFTVALTPPLQAAPADEKSLYDRLGGVFAIARGVDNSGGILVQNAIMGKTPDNPALRQGHTKYLGRMPSLKFMRTLWVCEVSGGPLKFSLAKPGETHLGLGAAHRDLEISDEFDEVAAELERSLDFANVPAREKAEVLAVLKQKVTAGYSLTNANNCDQRLHLRRLS